MLHSFKKMSMRLILIWALLYSLPCGSAQDLDCTVSQEAHGRTTYRIPDSNHTKCEISWTDVNNTVLATHEEQKDGKVLFKSETTLTTQTCIDTVLYRRDCISEGTVPTATCNATCTAPAGLIEEKGSRTHYIAISVFILALVVITGVAVRCCKQYVQEALPTPATLSEDSHELHSKSTQGD